MPFKKIDHILLWCLVAPALLYAFWTKWAVVDTHTPLSALALADFMRLHTGYYLGLMVWCMLMLQPAPGLKVIRLVALALALFLVLADMGYSTAIFYTGTLAPFDASYYAAGAVGALPFSIPMTEWLTLFGIPLTCVVLALWKLHQLHRLKGFPLWKGLVPLTAALLVVSLIPPRAPGLELHTGRPSFFYQILAFADGTSLWPQAMAIEQPSTTAPLALERDSTQTPPNLVIIALESVGAQAVGAYNPDRAAVTPYLNQLAKNSWMAEQAYAVVPHTSKALVALNCGALPYLKHPIFESTHGTSQPCLPTLLREQGYRTAFFQSPTEHFENRRGLATQLGFSDFLAGEQLDATGFQLANYFGYEDNILLQPSDTWIRAQQQPFFAFYLTGTTHHPYWVPQRHAYKTFVEGNQELNDYLNAVHYLDHFLKALLAQYKAAGLYDNTVFVIVGDHGESFGNLHPRRQHNASLYQEVMRIPLMIHAPALIAGAPRTPLVSQLDVMPTLLSLLGFQWQGELAGVNALNAAEQRSFAPGRCWYDDWCIASADLRFKYIHNFDQKGDELYDLASDPFEQHNIINQYPDFAEKRRTELLALQDENHRRWHQHLSSSTPDYWNQRDATLGSPARLLKLPKDDPRREQRVH